jgi:hypothetical protein
MGSGASKATKKDLNTVSANGLDPELLEAVAEALAAKSEEVIFYFFCIANSPQLEL